MKQKSLIAPSILFEDDEGGGGTTNHHTGGTSTDGSSTITTTQANTSSSFSGSSTTSTTKVIVHPLVLFHILDHHSRRQEDDGRVIGTLLGRRYTADSSHELVVEITNSFAVPHAERGEEVAIGKDFNKRMLALFLRTNRRETVVGWYASAAAAVSNDKTNKDAAAAASPLIADTSSLIHEFYATETEEGADPIHLVLDTRLCTNELRIRAYKSAPVIVQGEAVGSLFHELPVQLKAKEAETICLQEMILSATGGGSNSQTNGNKDKDAKEKEALVPASSPTSPDGLEHSMKRLHELLSTTCDCVDSMVEKAGSNSSSMDSEIGRQLADAMASIPRVRPQVLDQLFHESLQDLLMVTYLANLTQTQITIAEKINASLGITEP